MHPVCSHDRGRQALDPGVQEQKGEPASSTLLSRTHPGGAAAAAPRPAAGSRMAPALGREGRARQGNLPWARCTRGACSRCVLAPGSRCRELLGTAAPCTACCGAAAGARSLPRTARRRPPGNQPQQEADKRLACVGQQQLGMGSRRAWWVLSSRRPAWEHNGKVRSDGGARAQGASGGRHTGGEHASEPLHSPQPAPGTLQGGNGANALAAAARKANTPRALAGPSRSAHHCEDLVVEPSVR